MDSSIASAVNPMTGQELMPTSLQSGSGVSAGSQPMSGGESSAVTTPQPAAKRRPGRPKGSGKKSSELSQRSTPVSKMKRPVGRPRKDGFPAGSVGPRRSNRTTKSAADPSSSGAGASSMFAYPGQNYFPYAPPSWQGGYSSLYTPPMASLHNNGSTPPLPTSLASDTAAERHEWADLLRNKPNAFLTTLVRALDAPNPVSTAGPSVEESFKSHLVSLAPKGTQPIPSLYSILKTFWLPSSPAYFSLTASASTARTPSEHRFLYWDPQPLVFNGIACPSCSVPLFNNGRIRSGPIKVYDLERPFFIIGCEYVCESSTCMAQTSEGRRYASTDTSILRSLPTRLRDEFPAHLMQGETDAGSGSDVWCWKAMGVSRGLWDMVRGCLKVGLRKEAILYLVRSIQFGINEHGKKEEEEEAEKAGERDAEGTEEAGQLADESEKTPIADHAVDAYHSAWKANTAATGSSPLLHHQDPGPSTLVSGAGTMSANTVAGHQGYSFMQSVPPVPYPYAPYSYFQQATQVASQPPLSGHSPLQTQSPQQRTSVQTHGHSRSLSQSKSRPANQQSTLTPGTSSAAAPAIASLSTSDSNTLKRSYDGVATIIEPAQKRTRHCCKCGSQDCKGKGGRSFCSNKCQDCGKLDCKGRNSRRPDKRCNEAWS